MTANELPYIARDRAHFAALVQAQAEETFAATYGEEADVDREDRRYVDYLDVADPDEAVVAVPDWHYVPGADDDLSPYRPGVY